jgi:hypothetical protein
MRGPRNRALRLLMWPGLAGLGLVGALLIGGGNMRSTVEHLRVLARILGGGFL